MSTASNRRYAFILTAALAAGLVGVHTPHAQAQQVMRMSVSGGPGMFGGGNRPAMTQKDLVSYSEILGLDDAQKEAAKELLNSYTGEFEKASKEQSERIRRISEEFRETRDDEVWEQMGPIQQKFSKRAKELEATLISDIKTLCSDQQLNQWPKFERTRRRDRTIDRGTVSGESVDLVRIVNALELTGEVKTDIAQQLETYEQDLDKALVERNKIFEEQTASFGAGGGRIEFDVEKWEKQMRDAREAGMKIRDVNQRYTRSIEGLLPDAIRPRFQMDVKRASFPMVYKQSRTQRAFDAALKFDDLEAKQKEAVASLRQSYEQEIAAINDKWAAAIMEEEKDGGSGMLFGGGGMMIVSSGDEQAETPSGEARKSRRESDKKALKSLESLLTDAQKERLPQAGDENPDITSRGTVISAPGSR